MLISRESLYIFVEGSADRYLYSRLAEDMCGANVGVCRVVAADELGGSGGKEVLLGFFDYLRRRSSLTISSGSGPKHILFFLDKDVDDLLGRKRRSGHVVYTEPYEIENYLFLSGDLGEAAAAASSLDIQSLKAGLGDYVEWRKRAATTWKEWVKLCVFSRVNCGNQRKYYSRSTSDTNKHTYGNVDKQRLRRHLCELRKLSGMPKDDFFRAYGRISKKVERLYAQGKQDLVFKGSWYVRFLAQDVACVAGGRRFLEGKLREKLVQCLSLTLDIKGAWAHRFREAIVRVIGNSGNAILNLQNE